MVQEPFRLRLWRQNGPPINGRIFTCSRPGRSKGSAFRKIEDALVERWVNGLPSAERIIIISLLGRKPAGRSEFGFYSFRGGFDEPSDRPGCPTFQEWLDDRYGSGRYHVIEYPTVDLEPVPRRILDAVSEKVSSLLSTGQTVVLVDSGGESRTGQVCRFTGLRRCE